MSVTIAEIKALPRPFDKMFKPSNVVRPFHLLYDDLKKERTDISRLAFSNFLERKHSEQKGRFRGVVGYKFEFIPRTD